MNPQPATISFIIPVRNDAAGLRRCLQSIASSKLPAGTIEVIVADNGSTDGSAQVGRASGARVLHLPDMPVAELRNRGAAAARGGILAFVDADHEIVESWPATALELLSEVEVGGVGAAYTAPSKPSWVQRMYDGFRDRRPGTHDVAWLGSGNLAVSRGAFARTGGFDRTLEACEDVDFCRRLHAAGYRLVADTRLKSVHHGDPSTLAALFRSELWRGRNNLRVSLRGPFSIAGMPSIVIPIVDLASIATCLLGLASFSRAGALAAALAAGVFIVLSSLRALALWRRLADRRTFDAPRAFAVALVYDLARALALTLQIRHRRSSPAMVAEAPQS